MKMKDYFLDEVEKLCAARGQKKVLLHEKIMGREYNERKTKR